MNRIADLATRLLAVLTRSHAHALAALLALSLACFLPGFATLQPMDRDEPRFAQATKQMLETGDFVDIRFQQEARHKKPVGIYWLQAAAVGAAEKAGISEARTTIWLYRLPSLLGAVAVVLATYWAALALLPPAGAFAAAALMAASILLGVEARLAKTDAMLTLTAVIAFGVLARAWLARGAGGPGRAAVWAFWAAMGLAVLLKGPVLALLVGLCGAVLTWRARSLAWARPLAAPAPMLLALVIVLPWFAAITLKSGGAFFAEAVGRDMLAKVGSGQEAHWGPPGLYLAMFPGTFWPGAALVLLAIPWIWANRHDEGVGFCLAWIVPSWLLFEAVPTKLPHYVLPLYPALAILAARAAGEGAATILGHWRRAAGLVVPAIPLLLVGAAFVAYWQLEGTGPPTYLPLGLALPWLLLAILAGSVAFLLTRAGAGLAAIVPMVASATFVYVGIFGYAWPGLRSIRISPRLAEAVAALPCEAPKVVTAGYREPSLVFLVGTDLAMSDGQGAARFLAGEGCRVALVEGRLEQAFQEEISRAGTQARLFTRLHGFNINGGRRLDIGLYMHETGR